MTYKEAIKTIKKMLAETDLITREKITKDMVEACHIAIKALEDKNVIKCETAEKHNEKCLGYQKSEQDDEPIEECEKCLLYDGLRE